MLRVWALGSFAALAVGAVCQAEPAAAPAAAVAQETAAAPEAVAATSLASIDALSDTAFLREVVAQLTSDEFDGRRVGTEGETLSQAYLTELLTSIGVTPLPEARSMDYGFAVTEGVQIAGEPKFTLNGTELEYGSDYVIAAFSGSGSVVNAPLQFLGYGINAPELSWDDYAGRDVTGSVVIVVRGEPHEDDPNSLFAGTQTSIYTDLRRKAATARDQGAVAMLVVENPITTPDEGPLPELQRTYSATNFDIPVVHVKRDIIEDTCGREVLRGTLAAPGAVSFAGAMTVDTLDIRVEKDLVTGHNIVGYIPGTDPALAGEYLVIGAHYDHIGRGGMESTAPGREGEIHRGADDNASGVAAVLTLARYVKARGGLTRPLIVALFSGEEEGLLGSAALMKNPPVPAESIRAMLNFDMVGRLREDKLTLGGTGTASQFDELLDDLGIAHSLVVAEDKSGFGASDQMSFIREGIPALFFFTGTHGEYHNPTTHRTR